MCKDDFLPIIGLLRQQIKIEINLAIFLQTPIFPILFSDGVTAITAIIHSTVLISRFEVMPERPHFI
ncbi:MAG TPA: hypothetical protein VIC26_02545 [Marinagarivorans sp.]